MNENSYLIESGGDGGDTEIVTGEAALRKAVHDLMCCGQCNPIVMCETAGVAETLSTLDEDDEWSSNYPTYARFKWNADFEDGYIRVLNLGQRPADPAWISVRSQYPPLGATVQVYFGNEVEPYQDVWKYDAENQYFTAKSKKHTIAHQCVTHWQPLPAPPLASPVPKEKENDVR